MGKHLPMTKKSPCEATYQKFHSRIHVLEILLLASTHRISFKVSTMIPFAHLRHVWKLTFVASY
jgi:hypothetical protein